MAGPVVKIYGAITFYLENKEKIEAYLSDQEPALGRMTQGAAEVRRPTNSPSARS